MNRQKIGSLAMILTMAMGVAFLGARLATRTADAKPNEPVKPMPALKAGYIAMAEVMSGSKKWQDRARQASEVREAVGRKMGVLQASAQELQQKVQQATGDDREKLAKELQEATRKLETADRTYRAEVDKEAQTSLVEMQADFAREIEAIARQRQLDVVYGYPTNLEKMLAASGRTPQALQLYFQPTAMLPLYLRAELDLTKELIERLNTSYAAAEPKKANKTGDE